MKKMNAKNDDHTKSLHLLPTTSLENVNHINFGVSQEANIDVSQYTNKGEGGCPLRGWGVEGVGSYVH